MRDLVPFFVVFLVFCFLCAAPSFAVDLPDEGLVAYFPFARSQSGELTDESGRDNHAVLSGTEWVESGHTGGALSFDGDEDYLSLKCDSLFNENQAFSFSAWLCVQRKEKIEGPHLEVQYATDHTLYFIGETDCYSHLILLGPNRNGLKEHGRPEFGYNSGPPGNENHKVRKWIKGGAQLDDGNWHHIAGVSDSKLVTLYVDGIQVATGEVQSPYPIPEGDFRIGKHGDFGTGSASVARPFAGLMDEVALWNRALSPEEIAQVMAAEEKSTPVFEDRSEQMVQITDALLQGELESVKKILAKIKGPGDKVWNNFRWNVEQVIKMPDIVWRAYTPLTGKTVSVYLCSGVKKLFIKSVTDEQVEAEIQMVRGGEVVARVVQNFTYDDISPREKLIRLGNDQAAEFNNMRGILACCAGLPDKAVPYFEKAGDDLGKLLLERLSLNKTASR